MSISATITEGTNLFVTVGNSHFGDVSLDQAVLHNDTVYLARFPVAAPDFSAISSNVLTFTTVGAVSAGMHLSCSLVVNPFDFSTVSGTAVPGVTGTASTVTLGALAAGDSFQLDITAMMQTVSDGTVPWLGVEVTRLDSGAAASVWSYAAATSGPVQTVTWKEVPPQPSRLSPSGGRAVSVSQPILRVLDYAVDLGDVVLQAANVQWSASTSFSGSLLANDTLPTTNATFDMSKTQRVTSADGHTTNGSATITSTSAAFVGTDVGAAITGTGIPSNTTILTVNSSTNVTMSANATATNTTVVFTIGSGFALGTGVKYWRIRLQSADSDWGPWSEVESARFVTLGTLVITSPGAYPANVSADTNPPVEWTFTPPGTHVQAYSRVMRALASDPAQSLGSNDSMVPNSLGLDYPDYEVLSYAPVIDTVEVWDDTLREAIPGAPASVVASQQWSVVNDNSIPSVTIEAATQIGGSPFFTVTWSDTTVRDYRVRVNGNNVSGLLTGSSVQVDNGGEGAFQFAYPYFAAACNTLYNIDVEAVVGGRGSDPSDSASVFTTGVGAWLANPTSGDIVHFLNFVPGEWDYAEPNSTVYNAYTGDFRYRKNVGWRLGLHGIPTGELWPDADLGLTAAEQHQALIRMEASGHDLQLAVPHDNITVQLGTLKQTPMSHDMLPWASSFEFWQSGEDAITGDVSAPLDSVELLDFEAYNDGDAIIANDLIQSVAGSPVARAGSAMHGSTMGFRLPNTSGGCFIAPFVNSQAHTIDLYSSGISAKPGSDKSLFRWRASSSQVFAVHIDSNGNLSWRDASSAKVDGGTTDAKLIPGQPFRVAVTQVWNAGISHCELSMWVGGNTEGSEPDDFRTADFSTITVPAPNVEIGSITTPGFTLDGDNIRIVNYTTELPALGVPAGGVHRASLSGHPTTSGFLVTAFTEAAPQVKLAWSATADSNGFPSSPTYSSLGTPTYVMTDGTDVWQFACDGHVSQHAGVLCARRQHRRVHRPAVLRADVPDGRQHVLRQAARLVVSDERQHVVRGVGPDERGHGDHAQPRWRQRLLGRPGRPGWWPGWHGDEAHQHLPAPVAHGRRDAELPRDAHGGRPQRLRPRGDCER